MHTCLKSRRIAHEGFRVGFEVFGAFLGAPGGVFACAVASMGVVLGVYTNRIKNRLDNNVSLANGNFFLFFDNEL